jgi:hypothetical protein
MTGKSLIMIHDTQKKVRTTRLLSLSSEALDFAAPSTSGLAGFAMQVVQVMYLVDGNNLEARLPNANIPH